MVELQITSKEPSLIRYKHRQSYLLVFSTRYTTVAAGRRQCIVICIDYIQLYITALLILRPRFCCFLPMSE